MRVLVTNDDGIDSPGIAALAHSAVAAGCEVVVAAPGWDSSGASASLTSVQRDRRFLAEPRELPGLADVPAYAVEGSPGFIAMTATRGAFGPVPDVVLSGVNLGLNTGHAVLHSGTVGAALTATTHGVRALAVSIAADGAPAHWSTAADLAVGLLDDVFRCRAGTTLNLNVPNLLPHQVRGVRRGRLAPFGAVDVTVTEDGGGYRKLTYRAIDAHAAPDSDVGLVAAAYASVTPLLAVCEATG